MRHLANVFKKRKQLTIEASFHLIRGALRSVDEWRPNPSSSARINVEFITGDPFFFFSSNKIFNTPETKKKNKNGRKFVKLHHAAFLLYNNIIIIFAHVLPTVIWLVKPLPPSREDLCMTSSLVDPRPTRSKWRTRCSLTIGRRKAADAC